MSRSRSRSPLTRNIIQPPRLSFLTNLAVNNRSINNNQTMAEPPLFPAGFSVSLLNEIPTYNGNPAILSEFIRAIEVITTKFCTANPTDYINKLVISSIRNKLKGQALEVVTGYHYDTWQELKTTLVENFGDQRSELNLLVDLTKLKQNRDNPIEFFNKVRTHLAIFNSKISLSNETPEIINYKLTANKSLALRTFVSGLNENLGSFIRSRNPMSLEDALRMVKEELDIRYSQSQNNINKQFANSNPNQKPNKPIANSFNPNYLKPHMPFGNVYTPKFNNFAPNSNYRPQNQHFQGQNFSPRPPFQQYKPNFFSNSPMRPTPNNFQNPNQNVFAPRQNYTPMNKPEPMDISVTKRSASQQLTNPNKFRPNPQNFPMTRQSNQQELFYHEDPSENPENNYYEPEYNEINFSEELPTNYQESYPCDNRYQNFEEPPSIENEYEAENFQ